MIGGGELAGDLPETAVADEVAADPRRCRQSGIEVDQDGFVGRRRHALGEQPAAAAFHRAPRRADDIDLRGG